MSNYNGLRGYDRWKTTTPEDEADEEEARRRREEAEAENKIDAYEDDRLYGRY